MKYPTLLNGKDELQLIFATTAKKTHPNSYCNFLFDKQCTKSIIQYLIHFFLEFRKHQKYIANKKNICNCRFVCHVSCPAFAEKNNGYTNFTSTRTPVLRGHF